MTKDEILKKFDKTVERLFEDSYYNTITKVMERLNLNSEDLHRFVGKDIVSISPKHALSIMSGFDMLKLLVLISAKTSQDCQNDTEKEIDQLIDEYTKPSEDNVLEKIDTLLKLFGVTDEDSLDNLLTAVTDVKEAVRQATDDIGKTSYDDKFNCKADSEKPDFGCKCASSKDSEEKRKNECTCGKNGISPYESYQETAARRRKYWDNKRKEAEECSDEKGEVEYFLSYYDNSTMDKPNVKSKRIKFDPATQSFADVIKEIRSQIAESDSDN